MLRVVNFASALLLASVAAPAGSASSTPAQASACQASEGRIEAPDIDIRQCVASPDGLKRVAAKHGELTVEERGRSRPAGVMDRGDIVWNPGSTGFVVADSGGSGQTNYFSYVDVRQRTLHRDKRLRLVAARRYVATFKCRGPDVYIHSWFKGWQDARRIRLVVQRGVHSEGCVHRDPEEIQIGVIGDPLTGRIDRVLTQAQVRQEWCTPAERREYGLCYVAPKRP